MIGIPGTFGDLDSFSNVLEHSKLFHAPRWAHHMRGYLPCMLHLLLWGGRRNEGLQDKKEVRGAFGGEAR